MAQVNGHAESNEPQTAIVKASTSSATTALEPQSVNEAFFLAQKLVASGLLGKSIQKPESALAVILAGRELGLTAMQSLRSIHVIEGKPSLSSDLMVALVKRSPTCRYFKLVESTAKIATYETYREGEGITKLSFTLEQAQAAGVAGKDNWRKYPDAMLRARCIAALARAVYPDLLAGVYETDEIAPAPRPVPTEAPIQADAPIDADFKQEAEETEDEKIARWSDAIAACQNAGQLAALSKEIRKESLSTATREAVGAVYRKRKAELTTPHAEHTPSEDDNA